MSHEPVSSEMLSLANRIRRAKTARARLDAIDELTRIWHGTAPKGRAADEVDAAEARLETAIPAVVREWALRFGATPWIAFGQNTALPPADWTLTGDGLLRIGCENQNNWSVVVAREPEDPPVSIQGWHEGELSGRFSTYALQNALFESVMVTPRHHCMGYSDKDPSSWMVETFGEPVVEPWPDAGPGPMRLHVGRPGLAFHQHESDGVMGPGAHWLFFALIDDPEILRGVEDSAPITWDQTPTQT